MGVCWVAGGAALSCRGAGGQLRGRLACAVPCPAVPAPPPCALRAHPHLPGGEGQAWGPAPAASEQGGQCGVSSEAMCRVTPPPPLRSSGAGEVQTEASGGRRPLGRPPPPWDARCLTTLAVAAPQAYRLGSWCRLASRRAPQPGGSPRGLRTALTQDRLSVQEVQAGHTRVTRKMPVPSTLCGQCCPAESLDGGGPDGHPGWRDGL